MGGEVIFPIKLLMPSSLTNIREIALKTIPSVSKIEIRKVMGSVYGFDVEKVRTLNMGGKKKRRGRRLVARPDYKKAYVTLKSPLSISHPLYPTILTIEEEKRSMIKPEKRAGGRQWWPRGGNHSGDGADKFSWSGLGVPRRITIP